MKCTNNINKYNMSTEQAKTNKSFPQVYTGTLNRVNFNKIKFTLICVLIFILLTGCGKEKYSMPYTYNSSVSAYRMTEDSTNNKGEFFAENLCVIGDNVSGNSILDTPQTQAALLCDINKHKILYNKNALERLEPASLTKVMTAIVALKYGKLDDTLTATNNVVITESGASLVGISPGDTMTLEQALNALLIPSGNDAGVMIAEYVSGSVDAFVDLMNEEATKLGATTCHFRNPHGLTIEDHYVTAYDMYLIFNEAIKHQEFLDIIGTTEYNSIYHDALGNPKNLSFKTTNQFLNGGHVAPEGVTVIGGKTGTTNSAGACLVLLSKDSSGNPYISVVLKAPDKETLYNDMFNIIQQENISH